MNDFFGTYGRYPCPANPGLDMSDTLYGHEIYMDPADINNAGTTSCDLPCTNSGASNGDELDDSGTPIGVKCVNVGTRDLDGDSVGDYVMIGVVPIKTLARDIDPNIRLDGDLRFDGEGMQITYAVTEAMTDPSLSINRPANPNGGVINIIDEANRDLTIPPSSGHYVILSHGENSKGAYTDSGARTDNCFVGSGPPAPAPTGSNVGASGIATEIENCDDNDGIYVKGLLSLAEGDDYFDDIVFYRAKSTSALWRRSNTAPVGEAWLYNTNLGRVGVNNDAPAFELDVNGNVKVEGEVAARDDICASGVWPIANPTTDPECLKPEFLGGDMTVSGNICPAGQIATGIEKNKLVCEDILDGVSPSIDGSAFSCASSEKTVGIRIDINSGVFSLICEP